MKKTQMAMVAICLVTTMSANATMLVDRGLPTDNLNNAAGANRSNVAWAFGGSASDYWVAGDTFQNTSSQTWNINQITLWTTGSTTAASLWGGIDGSTIGIASGSGTIADVTYADGSSYQGTSGNYSALHQINFAVNILLNPGQTYDFFLDGTGGAYTVPFAHASNAALSGSPQDGADGSMLYAEVLNGILDPTSVGAWNSADPGWGWDKPSDLNVQVFGTAAVPEPSTVVAGALLLLPFGVSTLRMLRKSRKA